MKTMDSNGSTNDESNNIEYDREELRAALEHAAVEIDDEIRRLEESTVVSWRLLQERFGIAA